jgi:ABC-2 type transport system ATP-binding protein/nitrous oxidase accessory protein
MITLEHVSKRFRRVRALDDVSLEVPAGGSVALWGANGAGKTTLIRSVLGLHRFAGSIRVGGHDARRHGKRARMLIGYVPQELGFYDDLRVAEAVAFFARLKGIGVRSIGDELERVGLGAHRAKRIRELSGGMKQRLAVAIAVLGDPPVLVLDEVTASLDACGRREFVALLSGLSGAGRTMLFASHRIDEVSTLAKRVVMLERGRIVDECDGAHLASRLGAESVLHLTLPSSQRQLAMSVLAENGFAPRMNGVGVLVPVPGEQKAAPFRVLGDARVRIDDFELLDTMPGHSGAAHTESAQ